MKRLIVLALLGFAAMSAMPAKAQISVNVNIGAQPSWGPSGYNHVDYYYLPEVESYYYVPTRQFIYLSGNSWVHRKSLPSRHRNYNLHSGRKVVINGNRPYLRHQTYRTRYASNYSHSRPQPGRSRISYQRSSNKQYYKQEKHYSKGPKHNRNNGKSNGHSRGNDRGNGHGNNGNRGRH
ncbi:hypothetical protein [Pedobacter sp.]|uniref:hypothetical protein n=1 Tax=Pedobacter sp. TaxID=1411316 RepID=UPI003D7F7FE2